MDAANVVHAEWSRSPVYEVLQTDVAVVKPDHAEDVLAAAKDKLDSEAEMKKVYKKGNTSTTSTTSTNSTSGSTSKKPDGTRLRPIHGTGVSLDFRKRAFR